MRSALQLRCLIRNTEVRLAEYTGVVRQAMPGDLLPSAYHVRIDDAHAQLAAYRAELDQLSSPAEHPSASRATNHQGDAPASSGEAAQPAKNISP